MEEEEKIILNDDNLFWHSAEYRRQLFLSGADITKYTNPNGTKKVTGWNTIETVTKTNKNKAGPKAYRLKYD